MILYLTSKSTTNLLDFLNKYKVEYPLHKIEGTIDLKHFVIRDIANYSHFTELIIQKEIVSNDEETFLHAIEEFHTMYHARVTIICSGLEDKSTFIEKLLEIGVGNIVNATDLRSIQADIEKCLTKEGLGRYDANERAEPVNLAEMYQFSCENIKIGVVGSQSRVGTTTMALGLVHWLGMVGATTCYIEAHEKSILPFIAKTYDVSGVTDYFEVNQMQFTTKTCQNPSNFKVYDFGSVKEEMRECLNLMDVVIFVCGVKYYELPYTVKGLQFFKDTKAYIYPSFYVEGDLERYSNIFVNEHHELLQSVEQSDFTNSEDARVNYKRIIERYIAAE